MSVALAAGYGRSSTSLLQLKSGGWWVLPDAYLKGRTYSLAPYLDAD
jgi:hypothetical protein